MYYVIGVSVPSLHRVYRLSNMHAMLYIPCMINTIVRLFVVCRAHAQIPYVRACAKVHIAHALIIINRRML